MLILATTVQCAGTSVPAPLVFLISTIVDIIKIGIPLLLIIFGMLDLGKAVMAQKEDDIKKGQQTFIKRLVAAVIVFFVVFIVELVLGLVGSASGTNSNDDEIWQCVSKLINHGK